MLDDDSRSSDPAEVAEVDLLAEFRQHDGVQPGRYSSHMHPLLGVAGNERGGEVVGCRGGGRVISGINWDFSFY